MKNSMKNALDKVGAAIIITALVLSIMTIVEFIMTVNISQKYLLQIKLILVQKESIEINYTFRIIRLFINVGQT